MNGKGDRFLRALEDWESAACDRLTPEHKARLADYARELARWNRRLNLIRYREPDELIRQHIADGIVATSHVPENATSLVDVGAGGGIPGVVIAILRPNLRVVALEPTRKKHAFLRALRRELPIENYSPYAVRTEDVATSEIAEWLPFDVAISRATFSVAEWLPIGSALVRAPGGVVLAMEGAKSNDLPPGASRHPYRLNDRSRAIIRLDL